MIRNIWQSRYWYGLLICGSLLLSMGISHDASAIGRIGPDPDDFENVGNLTYPSSDPRVGEGYFIVGELQNGAALDIKQTQFKVYFPDRNGTKRVTITHADLCHVERERYDGDYDGASNNADGHIIRFEARRVTVTWDKEVAIEGNPGLIDTAYGSKRGPNVGSGDDCGTRVLNIPGNALEYSSSLDRYVAYIRAVRLGNNGVNHFRAETDGGRPGTDDDGQIGYMGKIPAREFGMGIVGWFQKIVNVDIPFAPDCTVTDPNGEWRRFEVFDSDNGDFNQVNPFYFRILEQDRGPGGASRWLADADYRDVTNMEAGSNAQNGFTPRYPADSNDTSSVMARFKPGKRYIVRVFNVWDTNNLQYEIPFDQIYYNTNPNNCRPFELNPTITANPADIVTPPGQVTFNFFAQSTMAFPGRTTYSYRITNGSGGTIFNSGVRGPRDVSTGAPTQLDTWSGASSFAWGGKVCATLTLYEGNERGEDKTAGPVCIVIGKKPFLQVRGGDVFAGGAYQTGGACSVDTDDATLTGGTARAAGGSSFGSWGEYGVFALGRISKFGSGSRAIPASGPGGTALTFANALGASQLGHFHGNTAVTNRCITDLFAKYQGQGVGQGASVNLTNTNGVVRINSNGVAQINASAELPPGKSVVVIAPAGVNEVRITSDIRFRNTGYTSVNQIPRVIILSDSKIVISPNVRQVDAWLVTKDELVTCEAQPRLTTAVCNQPLTINGAVIADRIDALRTAGADTQAWRPAEVLNMRANDYLRSYVDSAENGRYTTQFMVELPPRY